MLVAASTKICIAVEIAVASLDQAGLGHAAVDTYVAYDLTAEIIDSRECAKRGERKNSAYAYNAVNLGRAVEIPISSLNQAVGKAPVSTTVAAALAAKVIKSSEDSGR